MFLSRLYCGRNVWCTCMFESTRAMSNIGFESTRAMLGVCFESTKANVEVC